MTETALSTVQFLQTTDVQKKFADLLGERSSSFLTTLAHIVQNNDKLKKADPQSVYFSALVSATLDLPINPNFGFAYIVPYEDKRNGKVTAQLQVGYKGFIQLAQRSGQFKTISATPVYEGQLVDENPLTGYVFDWKAKTSDKIIGYAGYFSLKTGFEKTLYMTIKEVQAHGGKYSSSYKYDVKENRSTSVWTTNFDAMAQKTVIKLLLSKYAPLSVDMEKAIEADQSVIKDEEATQIEYVDNAQNVIESTKTTDPEILESRTKEISECVTLEEVNALYNQNKPTDPAILALFTNRKNELSQPIQS